MSLRIRTEDLGKRYRLGDVASPWGRARSSDHVWALRHANLEVSDAEVLGIVGPNGAGKSTLLKLLSEVTPPTEGRIRLRGRVGSILEVGTGFHWELTGRENVYLSGTILGMRRREIDRRFDEIVAFAGVERFLDTPVKRYSSGMYMRLAFAVAAHLDSEILIVDEVLAVGDADFQRRSLGTLDEVGRAGRTVLFVSHNLAAVQRLCTRAVLVSQGAVVLDGSPRDVVDHYLRRATPSVFEATHLRERPQVLRAEVRVDDGAVAVTARYRLPKEEPGLAVEVAVTTAQGARLIVTNSRRGELRLPAGPGEHAVEVRVPPRLLPEGEYWLAVRLQDAGGYDLDVHDPALTFAVPADPATPPLLLGEKEGLVRADCRWRVDGSS
jgi:lipopolysaccharide transport system ATP-binding protein